MGPKIGPNMGSHREETTGKKSRRRTIALAVAVLFVGIGVLGQNSVDANFNNYGGDVCFKAGCHSNPLTTATNTGMAFYIAAKGAELSGPSPYSVAANAGETFEIDFWGDNIMGTGDTSLQYLVQLPGTNWLYSPAGENGKGTANSPTGTNFGANWLTGWDQAASDPDGWVAQFTGPSGDPNTFVVETNGAGIAYGQGGTGTACNDGTGASGGDKCDDLDLTLFHGTDMRVTVPAGTITGIYPITIYGIGHTDAGARGYVPYTLNVDVTGGAVTPPTLTTPTATAIGFTTATLGANITLDGGEAPSEHGVVWATATGPVRPTNEQDDGPTTTGGFVQARTGLNAGTKIFYRGFAANSGGDGYSPEGSFYTEADTQASAVNFTAVGTNGMTVNWTRGTGTEVIVLMRQGGAVDADPTDGTYTAYTADAAFGSGAQIGSLNYVIYKGTGTSVPVTGLASSTQYNVAVYEMAGAADTLLDDQGTNYLYTPATGFTSTSGANSAPNPPVAVSMDQYKSDTTTPITQGTYTDEGTLVFKDVVSDPESNPVSLEIEIQPVGSAFTNSPSTVECTAPTVASGTEAVTTCTGLADGEYKWQARTSDGSLQSSWVEY